MWFLSSTKGRRLLGAIVFVFSSSLMLASTAEQLKPIRRVLIVHQLGLSSPSVFLVDQEIRAALEDSPFQVEIFREYLETTLFPEPRIQQEIRELYTHKYRDRLPDVVITDGPDPLRFVAASHEKMFPHIPVVFGGLSGVQPANLNLDSNFTGVWDTVQPAKTLEVALRFVPGTKHVVVIGGTDAFDLELEAWFHESLRGYESKLDFTYLTDLPMQQLLDRLAHLQANTIILLTHLGRDAAGTPFIGASQSDPMIIHAANAPVFSPSDVDLGHGEVGGYLDSFSLQGKLMGEMAVRILKGEKPKDIPIARGADIYMFDWRALRRWGFRESNLPPGSIVLNREPTPWELYQSYIVLGLSLILLETLLIFALLRQRARRRKTEQELAITYERLRLSLEAGNSVAWDFDVKTGQNYWFGDLQNMFGIPSDAHQGPSGDLQRRVLAEDWNSVATAIEDSRQSRTPYSTEFRVIRDDKSVRWVAAKGNFYYANNGTPDRMLGMAVDITDRKLVDEARSKLAAIVESSDDAIISKTLDGTIVSWNAGAEQVYGYTALEAIGNPITMLVPPELLDEEKEILRTLRSGGHIRHYETVRITKAHKKIDVSLTVSPVRDSSGKMVALASISSDITNRKIADQALAGMARKLIQAQEEERTRIGRELHDDINQRLALLAVEVDRLGHTKSTNAGARGQIEHVKKDIVDIGRDIQALSHQLHSSKLEYLGLSAAGKSLCHEMSDKHNVRIDFKQSNVPRKLPEEVSLSLFRVLQEALQNAVKYSGAQRIEVDLCGTSGFLRLAVRDYGRGFDVDEAMLSKGIGLASMRERVNLVNGEIVIKSQPMVGTEITVHVPVPVADRASEVTSGAA